MKAKLLKKLRKEIFDNWDLGWIILNDGEPLIVGNRWDDPSLLKGVEK